MLLHMRVGSISFVLTDSAKTAFESKEKNYNLPADQEHSGLSQAGRTCLQFKLLNRQTWRHRIIWESLYGIAKTIGLDLSALET